jgi:hypothetical protein
MAVQFPAQKQVAALERQIRNDSLPAAARTMLRELGLTPADLAAVAGGVKLSSKLNALLVSADKASAPPASTKTLNSPQTFELIKRQEELRAAVASGNAGPSVLQELNRTTAELGKMHPNPGEAGYSNYKEGNGQAYFRGQFRANVQEQIHVQEAASQAAKEAAAKELHLRKDKPNDTLFKLGMGELVTRFPLTDDRQQGLIKLLTNANAVADFGKSHGDDAFRKLVGGAKEEKRILGGQKLGEFQAAIKQEIAGLNGLWDMRELDRKLNVLSGRLNWEVMGPILNAKAGKAD